MWNNSVGTVNFQPFRFPNSFQVLAWINTNDTIQRWVNLPHVVVHYAVHTFIDCLNPSLYDSKTTITNLVILSTNCHRVSFDGFLTVWQFTSMFRLPTLMLCDDVPLCSVGTYLFVFAHIPVTVENKHRLFCSLIDFQKALNHTYYYYTFHCE